MQIIDGITFKDTTISLDDRYYMNCRIERCLVLYSGAESNWFNTDFIDCRLRLVDSASRILETLILFGLVPKDDPDRDFPIVVH
jgi:hypothetical protein